MKKTGNRTRKINSIEGLEHGFIRSQQKAFEVAIQYVKQSKSLNPATQPKDGLYKFPTQGAPFEISETALQNTLNYVYETLKHPCYMLCLSPKKRHFYKLEQTETAPVFEKLTKQEYQRVQNTLSPTERSHIEKVISQPFRIMQCIVKPQSKDTFSQEYLEWIGEMATTLPFGVFIFNLTDAVIFRKDGKMPFPKPFDPPTPILTPMLPVFSTSGQEGYWDIPIPTYDDIKPQGSIQWNTDWETKKEVAVFRGGPTGCGTRTDTNSRLAVAKLVSPLLDAGVVSGESRSIRYDPKHGLSMLSMEGISIVEKLTMEQQSDYKYIIHIDGNVLAYRLLTTMLSGSVLLRIKSPFVSWIDHYLIPNQHYIEVDEPKSLLQKIQWCKENDDICQRIALRSRELAERVLSPRFLTGYFTGLMWNTVTPKSPDCLPFERSQRYPIIGSENSTTSNTSSSSHLLSSKEPIINVVKPYRPNPAAPINKPIAKKTKKTTRKKVQKSSPPLRQVIVEPDLRRISREQPVANSVIEPTEPVLETSYMKTTEKEKCRKGFSTDKKNKMRCVASSQSSKTNKINPVIEPNPIVEENQQGIIEPETNQIQENTPVVPNISTVQQGSQEPYMKMTEKEKCRKGFLTDKKNKMRCVPK